MTAIEQTTGPPGDEQRLGMGSEALSNRSAAVIHSVRPRSRRVEVELNSRHDCIVRGPGAAALLEQVTGRSPTYIANRRGFSCQDAGARDAIALAERLSYDVVVTGPRAVRGGAA